MKNINITSRIIKKIIQLSPIKHKRRFQVYCIGAAKTGTTSLARMFSEHYYADHEPETVQTNKLVIDYLENRIDKNSVANYLNKRDRRLNLELESAHPLGYVSDILAHTFPHALFIITIREPYSWLTSRLNFHLKANPVSWEAYREYFWINKNAGFSKEESELEKLGLCSLDTYLNQYADHYKRVLKSIPDNSKIIIRTDELNASIPSIIKLLGIDSETLEIKHSKHSKDKITLLQELPSDFVNKKIWFHCKDIITHYFPETIEKYTGIKEQELYK